MGFIGQNNLSSFADGTWGFKWPRFNRLFWESYKQCVIFGTLITPALVVGFCVFADEMKSERSRNFVGWIVSGFGIIGLLLRPALLGLLEDPSMWSVLTIAFMITFGFGMTRVFVRPFDWDTIVIVWLTGGAAFVWILLVKAAFNSEGNPSGTLGWFRLCLGLSLFLGLSIYLGAVCYRLGRFGIVKDTDREPVGSVSASKRDGFPVLAWVQEIGTNATKASEHSRVGCGFR